MRGLLGIGLGCLVLVACDEGENPCDVYVDYLCACYADDTDFDCEEVRATYEGADVTIQDQCSDDLAAEQDTDTCEA